MSALERVNLLELTYSKCYAITYPSAIMAIHPSYPDIIVRIGAHGAYMRQYLDKGQDEIREVVEKASVPEPVRQNTVSHYVESITDTQFEIILDVRGYWTYGCPSLGFECLVDGQHIETTICLPHQFVDGQWRHILRGQIVPSVENGISFMRRFKFSGISLGLCSCDMMAEKFLMKN